MKQVQERRAKIQQDYQKVFERQNQAFDNNPINIIKREFGLTKLAKILCQSPEVDGKNSCACGMSKLRLSQTNVDNNSYIDAHLGPDKRLPNLYNGRHALMSHPVYMRKDEDLLRVSAFSGNERTVVQFPNGK